MRWQDILARSQSINSNQSINIRFIQRLPVDLVAT